MKMPQKLFINYLTFKMAADLTGIDQSILEQAACENQLSTYVHLSPFDNLTISAYFNDKSEIVAKTGVFPLIITRYYEMSLGTAAAVILDGPQKMTGFEDFFLEEPITVTKENLRLLRSDLEALMDNREEPNQKTQLTGSEDLTELINSDNPFLSNKLEAANAIALELWQHGTNGLSIRDAALKIIDRSYPNMGETGRKEIIKVINWHTGGAKAFPSLNEFIKTEDGQDTSG